MVEKYKLKEILIPENKHIEEEYQSLPKCNIFMSNEFYEPDSWEGTRALVLI